MQNNAFNDARMKLSMCVCQDMLCCKKQLATQKLKMAAIFLTFSERIGNEAQILYTAISNFTKTVNQKTDINPNGVQIAKTCLDNTDLNL